MEEENKVVDTSNNMGNGQNKCPKCGSTDISTNVAKGTLRCNFCRHEFMPQKLEGMVEDLSSLTGRVTTTGTMDIKADASTVMTFKCSSCGAEVVIDTKNSLNARCHWCRNTLTINDQIENGAVPDVVLPFGIKKDEAQGLIQNFVGKRQFFANPKFKQEFTTDNIMGVYFPYMLVDINSHATLSGVGEHKTKQYQINDHTYYDADAYRVARDFDLVINDLTVESNAERLNKHDKHQTNNIINSIMPFDTENCVKYNANYLVGYTSEKRDINIEDLQGLVHAQSKDVARFAANDTLQFYDRGVAWDRTDLQVKGEQWKAAYLPVWLYSYKEDKGNDNYLLHYVAVNARTKETMGSVPIHMPKLIIVSIIVEILGLIPWYIFSEADWRWMFFLVGFIFFFAMYSKYRNTGARHYHETETKKQVANMLKRDEFFEKRKRLSSSTITGCNNRVAEATNLDVGSARLNKVLANSSTFKDIQAAGQVFKGKDDNQPKQ